jgi:peptidoglycan hydrolase-like protein with peptidoglycan-binding domain
MRRTGLIVLGAALVAAATSCGGDSAAETTTTTTPTTIATTSTSTSTTSTTTATTSTTTTSGLTATATIFVVQGDLAALGYFEGVIDGVAGEVTRAALAAFQTDAGIEADGEFGPVTDAAMYPLLQRDRPYVEGVQEVLAELELYTGPIDGDYGRGTKAAVERLQADCGVDETGELEIATRLCLFAP